MATVSELVTHCIRVSGFSNSSAGDTALALVQLNDAYQRVVRRASVGMTTVSASLVSGTNEYSLADLSLDTVTRFEWLKVSSSASDVQQLRRVSQEHILELIANASNQSSSSDLPAYYATSGTNTLIMFPAPSTGVTLTAKAVTLAPVLVEATPGAGEEVTPSMIPASFHYETIANLAISRLQQYRGGEKEMSKSAMFKDMAEISISELVEHVNEFGGNEQSSYVTSRTRGE